MFGKKKEKEAAYYLSETNMRVTNYRIYQMSRMEKILYTLIAFAVGAAVGYLFYGGLAKGFMEMPRQQLIC